MVESTSGLIKKGSKDNFRLNMLGLPLIQTMGDLSSLTHVSEYTLYNLSKNADFHYRIYDIPKKNKTPREISQPSKRLKGLQSWILVNILNKLRVSNHCKGFEKGSSIADNAEAHIGANTILTIDLKDFFSSIDSIRIYNIFKSIGYNSLIATALTNICTFRGVLPQGSPCSPKLANLSAWMMDVRIQGYVGQRGISYTRYADDISLSGLHPSKVVKLLPMIESIINDEKFVVNSDKTRIAGSARAKKVTGLVLSDNSYGIGAKKLKNIRAKIYHLVLPEEQKNIKLLNELKGWLSYINSVDKRRLEKLHLYIKKLLNKNPETLLAQLSI
ncbi:MAG: RNA-directed DNA polymerase [Sphingobacteriaceae bacterium]|nr:MAG: RNA-directed DNA polymerase [Sphingobacteriaceae bacterium]